MDTIDIIPIWGEKVVLKLRPCWDAAWQAFVPGSFNAEIAVNTDSISATFSTLLRIGELSHFRDELWRLYQVIAGDMECATPSLTIQLEFTDNLGHLHWTISYRNNPGIAIDFYSDQTDILPTIEHLDRFLAEETKRHNVKHRKQKSG